MQTERERALHRERESRRVASLLLLRVLCNALAARDQLSFVRCSAAAAAATTAVIVSSPQSAAQSATRRFEKRL